MKRLFQQQYELHQNYTPITTLVHTTPCERLQGSPCDYVLQPLILLTSSRQSLGTCCTIFFFDNRCAEKRKNAIFHTWRNLLRPAGPVQDAVKHTSSLAVDRSSLRAGTTPCMVARTLGGHAHTTAQPAWGASSCVTGRLVEQTKLSSNLADKVSM